MLATALNPPEKVTPRALIVQRVLPGGIFLFVPHALEPQRQLQAREPLFRHVFLHISKRITATHMVPHSPLEQSS